MAKTRDPSQIRFHADAWKPQTGRRTRGIVRGLDTETDKGWTFLLTVSDPEQGDQAIPITTFDDFLRATFNRRYMASVNFFYNIDFDFSSLAKHMGKRHLQDLALAGFTVYHGVEVKWIKEKAFTLTAHGDDERKNSCAFYDLAQFYGHKKLSEVGKLVGVPKLEFDTEKGVSKDRWTKDKGYRETLETYAKRDALICRLGGKRLHDTVNTVVPVNSYYSPATIAQNYFLTAMGRQIRQPPRHAVHAALQSYNGGRFEIVRRGYFPKVSEIDINSAYPDEFRNLPSTDGRQGRWSRVARNGPDPEALIGFYKVQVTTHDTFLSPVLRKDDKGLLLYPHGRHEVWVEKSELETIQRMGFKAKILEGSEYYDPEPEYPFRFIEELYKKRRELKDAGEVDLEAVYKIILNSSYGKTIQLVPDTELVTELPPESTLDEIVREILLDDGSVMVALRRGWKAGKMFHPVYAATITARVRSRLLGSVIKYGLEDRLIGFATDAVYTKGKIPSAVLGKGLGAWKLEVDQAEGLFVGSGVYAIRKRGYAVKHGKPTKHAEGCAQAMDAAKHCSCVVNHFRGFDTKRDLFQAVTTGVLSFLTTAPIKLKEGVRGCTRTAGDEQHVIDWTRIGEFLPAEKRLDINFDRKRAWERTAIDHKDLLSSEITSEPVVMPA